MIGRRAVIAAAVVAFAGLLGSTVAGAATTTADAGQGATSARLQNAQILAYVDRHPDDLVGQDAIAFRRRSPSRCRPAHMVDYAITTATYSGTQTNRGSLRSTNGFKGGLWNVGDYEKGFVSQADNGAAAITVQDYCFVSTLPTVGAAFDYEANQGGGVGSVTVAYGGFSVSYSPAASLVKHLGPPPIYFKL